MTEEVKEITRESSLGFHFINTFQSCPRKWYIKYILGILPTKIGKALIQGKAWHSGLEVFYLGGSEADALKKMLSEVEQSKEQFYAPEDYEEVKAKLAFFLPEWIERIGKNLHAAYEVLSVEQQFEPKLCDVYTMTIRPDAVLKEKATGNIVVPEHKTTGYSLQASIANVENGDQATGYTWGLLASNPIYKLNFAGVLLDVIYARGKVVEAQQLLIVRSKFSLLQFELEMYGLFEDLAKRILKLESGVPEATLFPRNGSACSQYGCEYSDICRTRLLKDTILSQKYMIDPWKGRETLLGQFNAEHSKQVRKEQGLDEV